MNYKNKQQYFAVLNENKKKIRQICPDITDKSGIYFLVREDEDKIKYFYVGQAKKILTRMASHLTGYQHIDLSLKSRGWYSEDNPYGWKLTFKEYPEEKLDAMEKKWILEFTKRGYQARYNKTAGGQGEGKKKINEFRAARGYHDGLKQGHKNASKEIAPLFEKYLTYAPKENLPNRLKRYVARAIEKFEAFLNEYKEKINEDLSCDDSEES